MIKLIPQERLETMERKLMEDCHRKRLAHQGGGDLRSAVKSLHEHIEHAKVDTSTLDAWEEKLAPRDSCLFRRCQIDASLVLGC